jgi:hypothetical protein
MVLELVDYMISHFSNLQCEMCEGNERPENIVKARDL